MWWEHWEHFACNDHVCSYDEENNKEYFACNDLYSMTRHEELNIKIVQCIDLAKYVFIP